MSRVVSNPNDYGWRAPPPIKVHALEENKRPIGFAPWPEEEVEITPVVKKRKRKKK